MFLFLILPLKLTSGDKASIQGIVIDKQSQNPLSNVNIELLPTNRGDVSDSSGIFQLLNLSPDTYSIKASRIGYQSRVIANITLKAGENRKLIIQLTAEPIKFEAVKIERERLWEKYLTEASLVGVKHMRARDAINIPGALEDPIRAVQIFSGVSGGGDYSAFLAVRGGSPDQNKVIMDGFVVPSPYRFRLAFGGGMSAINPNTTKDIYLHLGGFSAEYGNSLSSVLEIESRIGNRHNFSAQGSLNLTDINGVIEGPFPGGIGSYLLSVRRTYFDLIANKISAKNSAYPYNFEINTKLTFDLNKNNRLIFNYIRNQEGTELLKEFSEDLNLTERANTHFASFSWKKVVGENWQFNTAVAYYQDSLNYRAFDPNTSDYKYESLQAKVKNYSFKEDVRYKITQDSWLKWGFFIWAKPTNLEYKSRKQNFYYARVESPGNINFDRTYRYYATYLENSTKASEKLNFRFGARYDYSTLIEEGEISPRFSIWYKINARTQIEASWGLIYQYPNPANIYSRNLPVDLSLNLDMISAEKATHFTLNLERSLNTNLLAKIQLYSKDMDRLILPVDETTYRPMNSGIGVSRGFELILEKKSVEKTRLSGIISYSYGNAKYRSIDRAEWHPFKYDRRHNLTILCNVKLFRKWTFSLLGQYASGLPYTKVLGFTNIAYYSKYSDWVFFRGARFGDRLPAYKKIDLRLSYHHKVGDKAFSFYLDIINLTNQKNIFEYTWEKRYLSHENQNQSEFTQRTIYMLPFIPSFGVSFKM